MAERTEEIFFEQPLNERVRTFLRLEFLFDQYAHHRGAGGLWSTRAALHTLLDIFSVIGRTDLKTDLMKDLGEEREALQRLEDRPEVAQTRLHNVVTELDEALADLRANASTYPAAPLRESLFLQALANRVAIPGGTCNFDLPAYHRWLCRSPADTRGDLDRWYRQIRPLLRGIRLYLRLLRASARVLEEVADNGIYLYQPEQSFDLLRVVIPADLDVYPEISASRHRFSLRFMQLSKVDDRNWQASGNIAFQLHCCARPKR
jgi:Uncharacterized protein conserved in bacteria